MTYQEKREMMIQAELAGETVSLTLVNNTKKRGTIKDLGLKVFYLETVGPETIEVFYADICHVEWQEMVRHELKLPKE